MAKMQFRPLVHWPNGVLRTAPGHRTNSRFDSYWSSTLDLLRRELKIIGAHTVVLQAEFRDSQILLDRSRPRADARPDGPAVIISFSTSQNDYMYPCDSYLSWKDNIRAIALTLEKLRAIDRYGVTKQGEQYRGWLAIPANVDDRIVGGLDREKAAELVATVAYGRLHPDHSAHCNSLLEGTGRRIIRQALANAHPDMDGTVELFQTVNQAISLL